MVALALAVSLMTMGVHALNATASGCVALLSACPNSTSPTIQVNSTYPTSSVCLSTGYGIATVTAVGMSLNLSRRNISVVTTLPTFVDTIDLSHNHLQSLPVHSNEPGGVPLVSLNLSNNALTTSSVLQLPGTIQTLDLSANRIVTLSSELAARLPRQLKHLSFKRNGMTSIDGRFLPATLRRLDLAENSIEVIILDTQSYAFVSHPEFDLVIEPNRTSRPTSLLCAQPPPRLAGNFICLIETSQNTLITAFLGKYFLVFVVVVVIGYAVFQSLKQYQSTDNRGLSGLTERSTYISSNYLEPKTPPPHQR